ncbi:MAG: hypothetical protein QGI78_02160 [Phycisphaerales bacterium]|nr:hypothetical protein [Phycisphaerales bacterium]
MVGLFVTLITLIAITILCFTVLLPLIGSCIRCIGRVFRFVVHEIRDIIHVPIALFVCVVKLLRATLCVVLARWDIAETEFRAAKNRINEVWYRLVAIVIDNPLRILAIEPQNRPSYTHQNTHQKRVGSSTHPSDKFSGYTIVGTLPPGGSGANIYIATPHTQNKKYVIKCFDITSGSQLPQIVRESRSMEAAKKLGLVLEHHLDDDRFWYVMHYHEGDHLGVVTNSVHGNTPKLSQNKLKTILQYQHTLLQTLREYHLSGLWHKDVKPDNIIIHNEKASLVDLGLVTPLASAMTLTTHGTEYFRDPELVRQAMKGVKVHQVDGSKFDIYSAGAVLYFMLENTFPPHGGLSEFNKESPEGIRWIVRRAMSDYDKRYDSIQEMLGDIEVLLSAVDVTKVRPADLPSMKQGNGSPKNTPIPRKLDPQSTPSTGGGPFKRKQYKSRPSGVFALLAAVLVGVVLLYSMETRDVQPIERPHQHQGSITETIPPKGKVLLIDECALALDQQRCQEVVRLTTRSLMDLGWTIIQDQNIEARVRSWLPENFQSTNEVSTKLEYEQLSCILIIHEDENNEIVATLLTQDASTQHNIFVE